MVTPVRYEDRILQPGDFFFGGPDLRLRTLLGSCVALTAWHPKRRIGGMCHYMLPMRSQRPADGSLSGRYADEAVEMFLRHMLRHGSRPNEYVFKVFGGGNMFPDWKHSGANGAPNVAEMNVVKARQLAEQLGLKFQFAHVGGHGHRQIIFDVWDGNVWVRHGSKKESD